MFWKRNEPPKPQTFADRIDGFRRAVRRAIADVTDARADRAALVAIARELDSAAEQIRMQLAMS